MHTSRLLCEHHQEERTGCKRKIGSHFPSVIDRIRSYYKRNNVKKELSVVVHHDKQRQKQQKSFGLTGFLGTRQFYDGAMFE